MRPTGDLTDKDVQNELRAIDKLCQDNSHPNLVSVWGHGQFFDSNARLSWFYMDMELCDFDLHAAIQNRQLLFLVKNPAQATATDLRTFSVQYMLSREDELECLMKLLSDVTSGLAYMHGLGEVHRDLKPHNSMSFVEWR